MTTETQTGQTKETSPNSPNVGVHGGATPASRFDYVAYDSHASELQAAFKGNLQSIEGFIEVSLKSPRAKALAITKLEECYMWIGKAIRDDQLARNGSAPLQESRSNS
jgi:hypothetical protein